MFFGPDWSHGLSSDVDGGGSTGPLFSHLLRTWHRLHTSDLGVFFQAPEQHVGPSGDDPDAEARLAEAMTNAAVGRLQEEKCVTVLHLFENNILRSRDRE